MIDVLLVEDHQELNELIRIFLEREGYLVHSVFTGEEALAYLTENKVKLMILDVSLPGTDGFAVCAAVREHSNTPILFLSARVNKEDKMNGFIQGADDYVEKPVDMELLCAKIKALMRREYSMKQENAVISSGGISIDTDAKQVFVNHRKLALPVKEYELLLLLVQNPGKTLRKEYLFDQIWGADSFSENQTLTVHIKMLRDKIEDDPRNPKRIQTVWGVGYKYEEI
ncbi:MAG: response regulator transcription factor [Lachnospiraceae bacterium]|nr:response regulator transcription factor [Lachnospiraceae bacterium]